MMQRDLEEARRWSEHVTLAHDTTPTNRQQEPHVACAIPHDEQGRRLVKVSRHGDNEGSPLYTKDTFAFATGITALVGTNGSGKTSLLNQIRYASRKTRGSLFVDASLMRARSHLQGGIGFFNLQSVEGQMSLLSLSSSEGETLSISLAVPLRKARYELERAKTRPREMWIAIDSLDSGLSIARQRKMRDALEDVYDELKESVDELFIVMATNDFESARMRDCIDVRHATHVEFSEYAAYEKFILRSERTVDARRKREEKVAARKRQKNADHGTERKNT